LGLDLHAVFDEVADHPDITGAIGYEAFFVARNPLDRPAFDARRLHAAGFGLIHEFGIGNGVLRCLPRVELLDHGKHDEADHEPYTDILEQIVQTSLLAAHTIEAAARL